MKKFIIQDEWSIIEEGFNPETNRVSESIFSIGNGHMGQRANFEENYSGDSHQGSYIAGIYYPDKTRVGWWKNGYPEYFAKVLNTVNWIGIQVIIENNILDLAQCTIDSFRRELDMRNGILKRTVLFTTPSGKQFQLESKRFISIVHKDAGVLQFSLKSINFNGHVELCPFLDGNVVNQDSNYDEGFWLEVDKNIISDSAYIITETKITGFQVCCSQATSVSLRGKEVKSSSSRQDNMYVARHYMTDLLEDDTVTLTKYVAIETSLNHKPELLAIVAQERVRSFEQKGFDALMYEHANAWYKKWEESDIVIEGDVAAQQAIRFNIFQLHQTYLGDDARLNIGPKGFTGEKYGGVTYWDTEAFCLPFYLRTSDVRIARNLLMYRYNHLKKAILNAEKLGFDNGAALYPMVTVNGEECHNEWEITFEEIHRNGAIAMAIKNYVEYTSDSEYLANFGLEVLIAISRFWAQRVNWSEEKEKYVMLGVTGPNEYENNVNNNWYTNYITCQTLSYTLEACRQVKEHYTDTYKDISIKISLDENEEFARWNDIIQQIYLPYDDNRNLFLQQDGFLDKDLIKAEKIPEDQRPINQHWSWDRILRSCFIKQADVLQGMYLFEDQFDTETIRHHFDFYEPMTVHESSLSSCIHSILASKIGYAEKAYELYLQTARLDLDDYNSDTKDGLHITSMGGTWMAIVEGFGGLRVKDGALHLAPVCPELWVGYTFKIIFKSCVIKVCVRTKSITIENHTDTEIALVLYGKLISILPGSLYQNEFSKESQPI